MIAPQYLGPINTAVLLLPQVVVCYGGSTIACIICGNPVAYVANEALASVTVATWTVIYLLPGPILAFMKDTLPGKVLTSITYETMRTHVMINCSASAWAAHSRTPSLFMPHAEPPNLSPTSLCANHAVLHYALYHSGGADDGPHPRPPSHNLHPHLRLARWLRRRVHAT